MLIKTPLWFIHLKPTMNKLAPILLFLLTLNGCALSAINTVSPDGHSTLVSHLSYGASKRHGLDIHLPKSLASKAPVVIFFYGGRWQSGDREEYAFVGQALAKRGIITVIPDYRLFPEVEFPQFIDDAAIATRWVLKHIQQIGGDPSRVYLMGHSAGAHIAALLISNKHYLQHQHVNRNDIAGFIGLSGPYDFNITDKDIKQVFRQANSHSDTQPIHFIDGSEPPMLLLHGLKDKTLSVKNSQHMAEKTIKMGGKAELVIYKDMAHVGTLLALADVPFLYFAPVLDDIEKFIHCTTHQASELSRCFTHH